AHHTCASQPTAFGADETSRRPSGAELTTDATLRSATLNVLPRRYCRPSSAPSRTRSGVLNRSAVALLGRQGPAVRDGRKHRFLKLGDRPETPLEGAALVLDPLRPQALVVPARQIEVDRHRLPQRQIAVLQHGDVPVRVELQERWRPRLVDE